MAINGQVHIFESMDMLYAALESHWLSVAQAAISERGGFHVALAGGGTPKGFYARLAKSAAITESLWQKTHIYFGDERCVPRGHADSNFCMARESFLDAVPVLPEHVHAMFSPDSSAEVNADRYSDLLLKTMPKNNAGLPVFDLVLLGMGGDGHTASLFPDTDILQETRKPVAAQFVDKLDAWRISLTFPVINAAAHVAMLVAGESKAEVLSTISTASTDVVLYPVQRVNPAGQLDWYLDTPAAGLIRRDA